MNELFEMQLKAFQDPALPPISIISNLLSLGKESLEKLNWIGIYLYDENQDCLFLGPFIGKPACTKIEMNKGVVGTCAYEKITLNIPNVHDFEGHIACDSKSNSELCIPLLENGKLYGVLDLDSTEYDYFCEVYRKAAIQLADALAPLLTRIDLLQDQERIKKVYVKSASH